MLNNFENWLLENKYKPTTVLDYVLCFRFLNIISFAISV